jgi:predicted lactoylglutathione lyase
MSSKPSQIFVNLPVKDLERSKAFFAKLGYTFNAQFTDANAACMVISENIFAMLLVEEYFTTFTPKKIADAKASTEVLLALSAESRAGVDRIVNAAIAAGGNEYRPADDHGFMFVRRFEDLDGHCWEFLWMDPDHVQK